MTPSATQAKPHRRQFAVAIAASLVLFCAAASMGRAVPAWAQAASEHALPKDIKGTPDTLIPPSARKPAPDFTLADDHGNPLTLSKYRGKVVLLDFWATWCGGCKVEIPWYVEFDQRYRPQGLAVIGVSMDDEGMKIVKPFLAQKHIDYPVVIGTESLGQSFGLQQMPLTLLIDKRGRIALSHAGVVDKADFERHIQTLLADR